MNNITLKEAAGYNLPLGSSIRIMRKNLRGDCTGDAFVIAHYNALGTRTVLHSGFLRTESQIVRKLDVLNNTDALKAFLDSENQEARFARCCTTANFYKKEQGTMALLFVKCKDDGVIGIAWKNNSSKKALLMCGFLGYNIGVINNENDKVLWESTTQYLIDDGELIRDVKDVKHVLALSFMEEAQKQEPLEIVPEAE